MSRPPTTAWRSPSEGTDLSAAPDGPALPAADRAHWAERRWARALRGGRGRPLGLLLLAVLVILVWLPEVPALGGLRLASFDAYQSIIPRVRRTDPVIIVAIDERSLRRRGQWPWPRTWLAQIVQRVGDAQPAAIGLALLISEADRLSPDRLPELIEGLDRGLAQKLGSMPTNDALLARALRDRRVVVGMAGIESGETAPPDGRGPAPVRAFGGDPTPFVPHFPTALRIVKEIDAAAAGRGLVNVDLERGVVRRIPLLASVNDTLAPTLGLEMLRVAANAPAITRPPSRSACSARARCSARKGLRRSTWSGTVS